MRKSLIVLFTLLAVFAFAGMAFAASADEAVAEAAASITSSHAYIISALVLGMAIAAVGCAIGQSRGLAAALEGTARNPEASGKIMVTLILGLAFIESMAIYALVVNLLVLFTKV